MRQFGHAATFTERSLTIFSTRDCWRENITLERSETSQICFRGYRVKMNQRFFASLRMTL